MRHAMFQDLKSQLGSSMHSLGRLLRRPVAPRGGARPTPPPQRYTAERAAERTAAKARRAVAVRMHADLADLLGLHPAARLLMRHLDVVEHVLRRHGLSAWERLPVKVHVKALGELESLVSDWSAAGLAELRSRTAVLLKNRPADNAPASLYFDATPGADVTEVEHSIFEESQRSWAGGGSLTNSFATSFASGFAPTQPG